MRKTILNICLLAFTLFVLSNCKKIGSNYDTYFYTNIESADGPLFLYVDDNNKGKLPNLNSTISATNDTILQNALHLYLKPGKYKLVAKDSKGNVKSSGTLKFKKNSLHTSGTIGGQATTVNDKIVVTKLYN